VGTLAEWPPPELEVDHDDILEAEAAPAPTSTLAALVEDIGDLECLGTAWQAAGVSAAALRRALGARAVVVSAYDVRRRELRVIGSSGPRAQDVLGTVADAQTDLVSSMLRANGRPLVMRFEGALPDSAPDRLRIVGASASLVAIAVAPSVAMVEVVDAPDAKRAVAACRIVEERLGRFFAATAARLRA
jgi:hypothetical protein